MTPAFDIGDTVTGPLLVDDGQGTEVVQPRKEITGEVAGVLPNQPDVAFVKMPTPGLHVMVRVETVEGRASESGASKTAFDRVSEYVRQFDRLRDTGGVCHTVHTDPDAEPISLTSDDLHAVLDALSEVLLQIEGSGPDVSCAGYDVADSGCYAGSLASRIREVVASKVGALSGSGVAPTIARKDA